MTKYMRFVEDNLFFQATMVSFNIHLSFSSSFLVLTSQSPKQTPPFTKSHLSTPQFSHKTLDKLSPTSPITKRRAFNLSLITLLLSISPPFNAPFSMANVAEQNNSDELEKYIDFEEGFTLLRPISYIKVDKAGATALFEEVNKGVNNVGVVVTPVRLSSLTDFGTPQFVADKLIQAEKRKESTKAAEVIGVAERLGLGGLPVYEFEYVVDSTRGGMKRIFSAAFVSEKKLYLLNITHSDKPESPLDSHTRTMLEKVLHSFDASPLPQNST